MRYRGHSIIYVEGSSESCKFFINVKVCSFPNVLTDEFKFLLMCSALRGTERLAHVWECVCECEHVCLCVISCIMGPLILISNITPHLWSWPWRLYPIQGSHFLLLLFQIMNTWNRTVSTLYSTFHCAFLLFQCILFLEMQRHAADVPCFTAISGFL